MDDTIFGTTKETMCKEFAEIIIREFEISMMGEMNFYLGLQIKQYEDGVFINQSKYVRELLKKFKISEAKANKTPMSASTKLEKDEKGKDVDSKVYRGTIGSLLYLTASRPDIHFSAYLYV